LGKYVIPLALYLSLSFHPYLSAQSISLINAFPELLFNQPVFLTSSLDGTDRIFLIEQAGKILVFPNDPTTTSYEIFLDITGRVNNSGSEEGLLGLAFHPDYINNNYFYVNYTAGNPRRTVISRFQADTSNINTADPNSEFVIMEILQPFSNHNGGMISFGLDGFLYIGMGDGGSGGDPQDNGQNRSTLLGAILRIDVGNLSGGLNYSIPSDNPFSGNIEGFREEIWAWGLRNPWRFSIDTNTGILWAGDVGQNNYEEIDIIENGQNYGWRIMEGLHCFSPSNCDTTDLILPIIEYGRSEGFSVTGGYVYGGDRRPDLIDTYIYGDFGSGNIWSIRYENGQLTSSSLLIDSELNISSFGIDEKNELYIIDYAGSIYYFMESVTVVENTFENSTIIYSLDQNYPNPFNPSTAIPYSFNTPVNVSLIIFDILGQEVRGLLRNMSHPAGRYEIVWDGKNNHNNEVVAGNYLYMLKVGHLFTTRKMQLIR